MNSLQQTHIHTFHHTLPFALTSYTTIFSFLQVQQSDTYFSKMKPKNKMLLEAGALAKLMLPHLVKPPLCVLRKFTTKLPKGSTQPMRPCSPPGLQRQFQITTSNTTRRQEEILAQVAKHISHPHTAPRGYVEETAFSNRPDEMFLLNPAPLLLRRQRYPG